MVEDLPALKAILDKSPKLDGRRCNVNLAYIGQKNKPQGIFTLHGFFDYDIYFYSQPELSVKDEEEATSSKLQFCIISLI